jgi:hypothetical protein
MHICTWSSSSLTSSSLGSSRSSTCGSSSFAGPCPSRCAWACRNFGTWRTKLTSAPPARVFPARGGGWVLPCGAHIHTCVSVLMCESMQSDSGWWRCGVVHSSPAPPPPPACFPEKPLCCSLSWLCIASPYWSSRPSPPPLRFPILLLIPGLPRSAKCDLNRVGIASQWQHRT